MLKGLQVRGDLPEAFVCGADIKGADVLMACTRLGIDVPGQLSVAGFDGDDLMLSYYGYPGLTTMVQPLFEMGGKAVELLLARIDAPDRPVQTAEFIMNLREGGNVGRG